MMLVIAAQEAGDTTYLLWGFILLAVAIAIGCALIGAGILLPALGLQ
jgi:hypothetical protein